MQSRRTFLKHGAALAGIMLSLDSLGSGSASILLRSSWQVENIGDIGHTPGVITLLEKYYPQVEVRLWPVDIGKGVGDILAKRFPKLKIITADGDVKKAFEECSFMLHGSGPSLVRGKDLAAWSQQTGKPYGIYGITFPGVYGFPDDRWKFREEDISILTNAKFALFRDSVSLEFAKSKGAKSPIMEFCPDGAFAVDLKDDAKAIAFLKEHNLKDGEFVCVIPQLRFTPWWELPRKNQKINQAKQARNDEMKEHDNAPVREAIIAVVRQTKHKVLIVPENETQMKIGREMLYDPLPDDVKQKVVLRTEYWLTDEAISTYVRSAGLFGIEMHSPIMCLGNGIPAIVCRFEEQTSKGAMWRDIGLGEWLIDLDKQEDIDRLVPTVLDMLNHTKKTKSSVNKALGFVHKRQKETMQLMKDYIS
jgi:hypothetical protein